MLNKKLLLIFIAFVLFSSVVIATDFRNSLIAGYQLNDSTYTSGGVVIDIGGRFNGTYIGASTSSIGLNFSAGSNDQLLIPYNHAFCKNLSECTIIIRQNLRDGTGVGGFGNDLGSTIGSFSFAQQPNPFFFTENTINVPCTNVGDTGAFMENGIGTASRWGELSTLVIVMNLTQSDNNKRVRFFLNGTNVTRTASTGGAPTSGTIRQSISDCNSPMQFGKLNYQGTSRGMIIQQIMFLNKSIGESEVQEFNIDGENSDVFKAFSGGELLSTTPIPFASKEVAYPQFGFTFQLADGLEYYNGRLFSYGNGINTNDYIFIHEFDQNYAHKRFINITNNVNTGLTNSGGAFNGTHHYYMNYIDGTKWFIFDDVTGANTANITYTSSIGEIKSPSITFKDGYFYGIVSNGSIASWTGDGSFVGINGSAINSGFQASGLTFLGDYFYISYTDNDVVKEFYRSNSSYTGKTREGLLGGTNSFILSLTNDGSRIYGGSNVLPIQIYDPLDLKIINAIPQTFSGTINDLYYDSGSNKLYMVHDGSDWFGELNLDGSRKSMIQNLFDYNLNMRGIARKDDKIYINDDTGDKIFVTNLSGQNIQNISLDVSGTLRALHWDGQYFWLRDTSSNFRRYDENFTYTGFTIDTSINHSGKAPLTITTYQDYAFITMFLNHSIAIYNKTSGAYTGGSIDMVGLSNIRNPTGIANDGNTLWVNEINFGGFGTPRVHSYTISNLLGTIPIVNDTPSPPVSIPQLSITPLSPLSMDFFNYTTIDFNLSVNITSDCILYINNSNFGNSFISPINTQVTHSQPTLNNGTFGYYYDCNVSIYHFNSTPITFSILEPLIEINETQGNQTGGNQTIESNPVSESIASLVDVLITLMLLLVAVGSIAGGKLLKSPLTGVIGCFILFFAAFSIAPFSPSIALSLILMALLLMWYFIQNGKMQTL